ncbi:ribonuclease H-like domain-containing protein, partial [Tanacetum coccineum]
VLYISSSEGLEKGYDIFQQLLSQLEAHGAEISTEDANHKFLRSLPPAWSNLAMTMRTKPDIVTLSINDFKSSTNKVKSGHTGANSTYTPSTSSNYIPKREVPAGFADEVIYSLFAKQSEDLDLLHEDLEQIDDMDIKEMDINWQIAMDAISNEEVIQKELRSESLVMETNCCFGRKKKLECFKCHNTGHFARECPSKGINDGKTRDSFYHRSKELRKKGRNQKMVCAGGGGGGMTMDDGVVNWGEHTVEEEETNHALMAISSNTEGEHKERNYLTYTLACLRKLEAQIVTFQKQQLSLNEQLTFQANEIYAKDEKLKIYRRIGMKAVKEKEQLQKTLDSWKNSSKNLWKLVDSGMTSNSKVGLGYEIQSNKEVLSYEEEMNRTVFKCIKEDFLNKPLYSRFSKTDNFKGVPHPLTRDYTPKPQEEIDDSFLCHLIKDCDYYEKKMARETEFKKQRVFNAGNKVAKPVWNNANRVNRANHFVPRPVQLNAVRANVNTGRANINTVRANVNSGRTNVNSVRPRVNTGSSNVNTVRSRQPVPTMTSNRFSPKGPQDHPLKNMGDRGEIWFEVYLPKVFKMIISSERDVYEKKKLNPVQRFSSDNNVADLLTKAFNGPSVKLFGLRLVVYDVYRISGAAFAVALPPVFCA